MNKNILHNIQYAFTTAGYLSDEMMTVSLIVLLLVLSIVSCVTYVLFQLKIGDFMNCVPASIVGICAAPAIPSIFSIKYNKNKLREVIDGFQKIFDACN